MQSNFSADLKISAFLQFPCNRLGLATIFPKAFILCERDSRVAVWRHAYCRVKCTSSEIPRSQPGSKRRIGNAYNEKDATCFDTCGGPYRRRHWRTGNPLSER